MRQMWPYSTNTRILGIDDAEAKQMWVEDAKDDTVRAWFFTHKGIFPSIPSLRCESFFRLRRALSIGFIDYLSKTTRWFYWNLVTCNHGLNPQLFHKTEQIPAAPGCDSHIATAEISGWAAWWQLRDSWLLPRQTFPRHFPLPILHTACLFLDPFLVCMHSMLWRLPKKLLLIALSFPLLKVMMNLLLK